MERSLLQDTPFAKYKCKSKEMTLETLIKQTGVKFLREPDGDFLGQVSEDYKKGLGNLMTEKESSYLLMALFLKETGRPISLMEWAINKLLTVTTM